jgi:membrane protease YdiL (CAAX protease family)
MTGSVSEPDRHPLSGNILAYLALAYGISWIAYFVRGAADWSSVVDQTLRLVTKFGPSLAGVIMAITVGGMLGFRTMLGRLLDFRQAARWYAVALFLPIAILVIALPIRVAMGGVLETIDFEVGSSAGLFLTLLATRFFAGGGLGEELGWRGFMLPQLQAKVGALHASVIIGLFHAGWHLPAYGIAGTIFLSVFTVSAAIVFTWMYNRTGGNLLLPALMHASGNASLPFFEAVFPALDNDVPFVLIVFMLWALVAASVAPRLRAQ